MIYPLEITKGSLFVQVQLWGIRYLGQLTLALDTGAAITVLNSKLVGELGVDMRKAVKIPLLTGSGNQIASKIVIPKIRALGKSRLNFEVATFAMPKQIECDGLLGLDFFSGLELNLNFRTGHIELK